MPRIKSRAVFIDPIIKPDFVELLEEDAPEKACISCVHNIRIPRSAMEHYLVDCYCEIDNHYIGYCENWDCTCRHHELKEKKND